MEKTYRERWGNNMAIIGASRDRGKFSNKAVRAFLKKGYNVYPINLNQTGKYIKGIEVVGSIMNIQKPIDFVSIYLNADNFRKGKIGHQLRNKKVKGVILNRGTINDYLIKRLKQLEFEVEIPPNQCSITGLGLDINKL